MKTIITLGLAFILSLHVYSQQQLFYVCTGYNPELLKINEAICDTIFIGYTDSIALSDIAITSDYKLYGINGSDFYQIDTSNAHLTLISHMGWRLNAANSLVADSAGNLLTAYDDSLFQINRFTGQFISLGYIGYRSAGDLTFYNDTLYLAGGDTCCNIKLIQIILHPTVSAHSVGIMNAANMFGINTICINNVETMIATGGDNYHSNLYQVNPTNANLTLLCDSISHYLIDGAASIYDINGIEVGCSVISGVKENLVNDGVVVYPNPFDSKLTVVAKINGEFELTLFDVFGRVLLHRLFTNQTTINTEQLASGIYFYEIKDKNGVGARGKVVKDH